MRPTTTGESRTLDAVADANSASDRRFADRRSVNTRAYILVGERRAPLGCVVRDISSTGAFLEMSASVGQIAATTREVPPTFVLQLPIERVEITCEAAWREDMTLGVRFTGPSRIMGRRDQTQPKAPQAPKTFGRLNRN